MDKNQQRALLFLVNDAVELRHCQHLFLRGNHQETMFYDKVDMINAWNRLWLSAAATGVQVLSAQILGNHLHLNLLLKDNGQRTRFKRHFRMSITQKHNLRYHRSGVLGDRSFRQGVLHSLDDLKDCICYHIRNVLHHDVFYNFMDYNFSTGRFVFDLETAKQKGIYTRDTLPKELEGYLPVREKLPQGWMMTADGLIVPPAGVFRRDIVEVIFGSREDYLEALSHRTTREAGDRDAPLPLVNYAVQLRNSPTLDEQVAEFVKENCGVAMPCMTEGQKMEAIFKTVEEFPRVNKKLLTRLFGIPYSTLSYRLKHWRKS